MKSTIYWICWALWPQRVHCRSFPSPRNGEGDDVGSVCLQCFLSLGGGGVERISLRKWTTTAKENTSVAIDCNTCQTQIAWCCLGHSLAPRASMVLLRSTWGKSPIALGRKGKIHPNLSSMDRQISPSDNRAAWPLGKYRRTCGFQQQHHVTQNAIGKTRTFLLSSSRRICGIVLQGTVRPVTCVRKSRYSYLGSFQTPNYVLTVSAECFFGLFLNCITLALALILLLLNNCVLWRSLSYTTRNLILREGKETLWLEQKVLLW